MEGEELENSESDDNEEDKSKMKIGQLKRAEYSFEDNDLDQVNKESWNFPQITKDKIFKTSFFKTSTKYVCEKMEGCIAIEDCKQKAAKINIIS